MKKEEFEIGKQFYTACGLWICTGKSDTEIRAKQLWMYTTSGKQSMEDQPEVTFNNRHWPACREDKPQIRMGEKPKKIPCFRCYNDDPNVPRVILGMGFEKINGVSIFRGTTTVVCARCRRSDEESCFRMGKYKWICPCGANIWHDDPKTDEKCLNCDRERGFWTPVHNG